jgi:hypothetical protein
MMIVAERDGQLGGEDGWLRRRDGVVGDAADVDDDDDVIWWRWMEGR